MIMMKHIEQQIEEQKRLLFIDLPALRNHNTLMRKLKLLPRSEIDLAQLDRPFCGSRPLQKRFQRRFFNRFRRTKTEDDDSRVNSVGCESRNNFSGCGGDNSNSYGCGASGVDEDGGMDERSVSGDELFVHKSADMIGVGDTSPSSRQAHIGYSNPLTYDYNDFEDIDAEGDDDVNDIVSLNSHEEFHRYFIDDEVVIIGALPTPTTSSGPSIVVCTPNNHLHSCDLMCQTKLTIVSHSLVELFSIFCSLYLCWRFYWFGFFWHMHWELSFFYAIGGTI